MKKYILTIALFAAVAATTFAQQRPQGQQGTPEERAKRSVEMMDKNLTLTADQKTKIYDASLVRANETKALRDAAGEGNRPDAEKMKAVNEKFNKAITDNLTGEQKVKYEEVRANGRNGNGQQRPEKPKSEN